MYSSFKSKFFLLAPTSPWVFQASHSLSPSNTSLLIHQILFITQWYLHSATHCHHLKAISIVDVLNILTCDHCNPVLTRLFYIACLSFPSFPLQLVILFRSYRNLPRPSRLLSTLFLPSFSSFPRPTLLLSTLFLPSFSSFHLLAAKTLHSPLSLERPPSILQGSGKWLGLIVAQLIYIRVILCL